MPQAKLQPKTYLMRSKKNHTALATNALGKRTPVDLHMTAFSIDGVEYELEKDGTFEAREEWVTVLEAHGFERVPEKVPAAA